MTHRFFPSLATIALLAAAGAVANAQVVSHLNLVSDKSQDISTLDAWKKAADDALYAAKAAGRNRLSAA